MKRKPDIKTVDWPVLLAAVLLLLTGLSPASAQELPPGPVLSPALQEVETLYKNQKYAIVLEKALGLINTGGTTLSPEAGGFLHYYVALAYKNSDDSKNAAVYFKKIFLGDFFSQHVIIS